MTTQYHAIIRTSPKGEGQKFIGTCSRCGKTGLLINDSTACENTRGVSQEDALLEILQPDKDNQL